MNSRALVTAGILGFLAVVAGAFGAHGLESRLDPDMLAVYRTGVEYHVYHALAMLIVAANSNKFPRESAAIWASRLWFAGVILFSGSLYLLALTGQNWLGAVTPAGGLAFLAGWAALVAAAFRPR